MKIKLLAICLLICIIFSSAAFAQDAETELENQTAIEVDDDKPDKYGESDRVKYAKGRFKNEGFNIPLDAPTSLDGYQALYTANMLNSATLRDRTDDKVYNRGLQIPEGAQITIYHVEPNWVLTEYKGDIGWIKRIMLNEGTIQTIDPKNTAPYGVQDMKYIATITEDTYVLNRPDPNATPFKIPVDAGAKIALFGFENGYAKVNIWRNYGYIDAKILKDVQMIAPSAEQPLTPDMPLAAYCSFFDHSLGKESNDSRVINIAVSCKYMTMTLQPGESFDFNAQVGPYKRTKGYQPAPVLINGGSQLGYGGGTCQSSSTLYNVLKQMPGITILWRRPHGPGSAKYLPQHMDAAVGNQLVNLKFRNDYDFPVRFEAQSVKGCLFIAAYKVQDDVKAEK